jgi:glucose-6-phosphate 1-dehydrogenase
LSFVDNETKDFIKKDYDFKSFLNKITYTKVELSHNDDYKNLSEDINKLKKHNSQVVIYLSISPEYFGAFIDNSPELNLPNNTKIIFEKPF